MRECEKLRIGFYDDNRMFSPSTAVRRAVREGADVLRAAGCTVEEFEPPDAQEALRLFYNFMTAAASDFKAVLKGSTVDRSGEGAHAAGGPAQLTTAPGCRALRAARPGARGPGVAVDEGAV